MGLGNTLRRVAPRIVNAVGGTSATLVHRPAGRSDPDSGVDDTFDVATGFDASPKLKEPVSVIVEGPVMVENRPLPNTATYTLPALGLKTPPVRNDELCIGTTVWLITDVQTIEHEGLPILYTLEAKR